MNIFKNQNGAVMLLVALLAASLLMLAGLAIDSAVIANSKVQQRHASEYMALGALKAFSEETSSDKSVKLNTAKTRAQQLAQENYFLAKSFLEHNTLESIGTNLAPGDHGFISPGIWYFKQGLDSCNGLDEFGNPILDPDTNQPITQNPSPCPCKQSSPSEWATPCFRTLDFSLGSTDLGEIPNAVRVELKTSSSSPIKTLFARVKGQKNISISSSATAVQLPRKAVFLVDLSRHSHNETHIPNPFASNTHLPTTSEIPLRNIQSAGEYTFSSQTNCNIEWSIKCPYRLACDFNDGSTGSYPKDLYNTLYNGRKRNGATWAYYLEDLRAGPSIKSEHYKNDYICFSSSIFRDYMPNPTNISPVPKKSYSSQSYLVDTYYGSALPSGIYDGPEPLNTMMVGIYEALQQFKANKVPGDEITVIGFDGSAKIDIRRLGPIPIDESDTTFLDLENMSNLAYANPDANADSIIDPEHIKYRDARFKNHLFIPRVDDKGLDKQKNIVEALTEAKKILLSAGSDTSENFVVLISDGISSCFETGDSSVFNTANLETKRCNDETNPTFCSVCQTSYSAFINSLRQAEKIIAEDYIPNDIKFHFVQIGNRSKAHTLQKVKQDSSGNKSCMSVEEMLSADPPEDIIDSEFDLAVFLTAEEEFKRLSYGEIDFPSATEFAKLAISTKGKYIPITPPCDEGVDKTSEFNDECKNLTPINNPTLGITTSEDRIDGNFSDQRGRVTCDILGRDRRSQMRDAIYDIFNIDPYIIID